MTKGEYHAVKHLLWSAVELMTKEQQRTLRHGLSALRAGLVERWGQGPSGFQREIMDEFERLEFRLRHFKARSYHEILDSPPEGGFFCIKCDAIATGERWDQLICPVCDSVEWLEFVAHG
ncbi:MAG: hypothetical protein OXK77_05520 [Gemmatimonadota bacterium]|nr:hypothetical protein [Gemmatimonadota bacterium]